MRASGYSSNGFCEFDSHATTRINKYKNMLKKSLIIGMTCVSFLGISQTQCGGITKDSTQCENITKKKNSLCHNHDENHIVKQKTKSVICSGTTKENRKCKRKTTHLSGRCHNHRKNN